MNFKKTIQAATLLAEGEPGSMISRMRLLKLLYIADRESLGEIGRTISDDAHAALKKGPILSDFYDVIKGETTQSSEFNKFFKSEGYRLRLLKSAGLGHLNKFEIRKLKDISQRFQYVDDEDLSELTHGFAEWEKNVPKSNSSRPISRHDILEAIGKKDATESVHKREQNKRAVTALWSEK